MVNRSPLAKRKTNSVSFENIPADVAGWKALRSKVKRRPITTLSKLSYWNRHTYDHSSDQKHSSHDRYVTFEDDTGGWNNIRMAFEGFVAVAKLTKRTLVLPPSCRFYLLDYGPIKLFKKNDRKTFSNYGMFFDLDDLRASGVDVITTREFLDREAASIRLPQKIEKDARLEPQPKAVTNGHHTPYFYWLRESPDVQIWPTHFQSRKAFSPDLGEEISKTRKILHFPMQISKDYRYLSGVPQLLRPASSTTKRSVVAFLRDSLHYNERFFREAAEIIDQLGGIGAYDAMHIRRNDLQYHDQFISAKESAERSSAHLKPNAVVYLATDETEEGFFAAFEQMGFTVKRLSDFRSEFSKFDGMVEQIVCAASRMFAGTKYSTFTAYIQRLRGFMHPEKELWRKCFYHTEARAGRQGVCNRDLFGGDALLYPESDVYGRSK